MIPGTLPESEGITLHTNTSVEQFAEAEEGIEANRDSETLTVDASDVLIAAGRQPNGDGLNLDSVGIEKKGFIEIDEHTQRMTATVIVNPPGKVIEAIGVDVDAAVKNQLQTGLSAFV